VIQPCLASRKDGFLKRLELWNREEVHLRMILRKKRKTRRNSLWKLMNLTVVKMIIIVEGALQGNGIGTGTVTVTGNPKGITGTEIMIEIGIMIGIMEEGGKETEIEIVKETEETENVTTTEIQEKREKAKKKEI